MATRLAPAAGVDERYMRLALDLALEGWGQTAPNPLVGAVVVQGDTIVGRGAHRRFGEAHAEIEALNQAGSRAVGSTIYVTLEPCSHQGKTPPCVDAIRSAGVSRVVVATSDPNPEAGGGLRVLEAAGVVVVKGPLADEARELNAPFFHRFRSSRPWTTLKFAISLDGAIADAGRAAGWVTGSLARREVHRLRAGSDAVGVGMGTVLADDPLLTVREAAPPRIPPARVVFSRHGRLPLTSRLAQTVHEAPVIVLAESVDPAYEHLLRQLGVEVSVTPSLAEAMQSLAARGIHSLLVEGGARVAAALLHQRLVDRLVVFQAPVILGHGALNAFEHLPGRGVSEAPRLRLIRRQEVGDDLMSIFELDAR